MYKTLNQSHSKIMWFKLKS